MEGCKIKIVKKIKTYIVLLLCLLSLPELKAQDTLQDFSDDAMIDFLYQYTCCDEARFDSLTISGIGILLEKAKADMKTYEYVLGFLLNGYSNMGKSQVVDYLLTYPKLFEGEISMEEGLRLDSITEPYQKVKVGAKAPDFEGVTIDGRKYHLYESEAKPILIVFWSTDCEYCHDFLIDIRKHMNLKTDYELVTFALAESQEEVREAVKSLRLNGYHFYDPLRWESQAFLDYHITSTPTVFLLDTEKNIICKPYDWLELKHYLKRINN